MDGGRFGVRAAFKGPRLSTAVVLIGDVAVFVIFSFLGRESHHRGMSNPIFEVAGTAAPFVASWLAGGWILGAYRREVLIRVRGLLTVAVSWTVGAVIAIVIRSILERRVIPLSFMIVIFLFNLVMLSAWRTLVLFALPKQSAS